MAVDEQTEAAAWDWKKALRGIQFRRLSIDKLDQIKGLEYQWAILVISEKLADEVEFGFTGVTRRVYNNRRLLRIPFTRAKDGLFVIPSAYPADTEKEREFRREMRLQRWASRSSEV